MKTLGEKLGDVKAEALIDSLPATPPEEKAGRLGDTVCDIEVEALVDTLAETSIHKSRDTCGHTGRCGRRSPGLEKVQA